MFVTGTLNQLSGLVPDIDHYDFECLPLDTPHCDCGVTGQDFWDMSGVSYWENLHDFKGVLVPAG